MSLYLSDLCQHWLRASHAGTAGPRPTGWPYAGHRPACCPCVPKWICPYFLCKNSILHMAGKSIIQILLRGNSVTAVAFSFLVVFGVVTTLSFYFQSMQILKKSDLKPYFIYIAPCKIAKLKQMCQKQGVSVTVCTVLFLFSGESKSSFGVRTPVFTDVIIFCVQFIYLR